jgi:histidine decarboxylase
MPHSLLNPQSRQRLELLANRLQTDYAHYIGFPGALDYDYTELTPFFNAFLNNVGDPHLSTWHVANTKDFECEVVDFCASLFRAPADDYWGYVTNGSTECNLYALYLAREKLPGATVYYSSAAHYSIPKNIHLLAMNGQEVSTKPNGEMDYRQLQRLVTRTTGPAIVVATIGTTMTEAKDNVATIKQILQDTREPHHIHADAALAGIYTALLTPHHPFDFQDGADSVNVSGHKFFGSPIPSGVIVVRKQDKERLGGAANYTGSIDTTISGSRNGHTPLLLWYAIQRFGVTGLRNRALEAQHMAAYMHRSLQVIGWPCWRNPHALTVMLATPSLEFTKKWQLATQDGWSHVICMPGVSKTKVEAFVTDLARSQARLPRPRQLQSQV